MRASPAVLFRAPAFRIAGRIAAPAPAPTMVALSTLWVGFALAPELHTAWRGPAILVLAMFAGASAELVAQYIGRGPQSRAVLGMLWPLPAGAVIALAEWLSSIGPRPWIATPLAALAIVAVICLQWGEVRGGTVVRAGAHTVNTGFGFALAFGAYAVALSMPVAPGILLLAIATFGVALVVLRGPGAGPREVLLL
ncbi:MAG: hypothetical protein GEU73_16465, partial [Chloroflexi bacterium]|nr:hypothetical protein [Chloroflexota bacterium]